VAQNETEEEKFTFDEEIISSFDTVQLFTYAIALFIGGVLGDIVDLRKLLFTVYTGLGFSYLMLALGGEYKVETLFYYYLTFFLIGLFSSILWPSMIHMLGNWFSKTNRGLIIGAWATCANTGNIVGI
jgi:sugar phosphate permease